MKTIKQAIEAFIESTKWSPAENNEAPSKNIFQAPASDPFWALWKTAQADCKAAGLSRVKIPNKKWAVLLKRQNPTPETTPERASKNVMEITPEATEKGSPQPAPGSATGAPCTPSDIGTLLRLIHEIMLRFMAFSAPEHAVAITLWIAHTWVYEVFGYTPYLFIYSPTRRCGKSRIFDCLNGLARQAWLCAGITGATLFRKIDADGPTTLIDEIDTIFPSGRAKNNESLRCVLNAGFCRGTTISRCSGSGTKEYNVFCPKAFSGIGDSLPDTVKDRSIRVPLSRRAKHQNVEKFRSHDVEEPTKLIADGLSIWAANEEVLEKLRAARPAIPDELGDRAADISEPLLAISDLAGGEWPQAARAALVKLLSANDEEHDEPGVKLLAAIRDVFAAAGKKQLPTAVILRELSNRDEEEEWTMQWPRAIAAGNTRGPAAKMASLLKPFGISAGSIRLPDGSTPKGYRLEAFEDAFSRYLPDLPPKNDATTPHGIPDNDTPTGDKSSENGEKTPPA